MHLKQNPTQKFPKRAMKRAESICRNFLLFNEAADALQKAIDEKRPRSELYWRNVFGAFAHIVLRRRVRENPWHLYNTAAMYAYTDDQPRWEPDLEYEKWLAEHEDEVGYARPQQEPDGDAEDDKIPF
jgi:hypothetical protein